MAAAAYLLILIGVLGAFDIAVFHTRAHRLRTSPSARHELITHALRGPTYAILFSVVPNLALHGAWFIAMLCLLVFDVAISIADFALEKRSRAPMGGLPTGEYVLHSVLAMLFGAFVALYWVDGSTWLAEPTAIVIAPVVAWPWRVLLGVMAVGVLASGVMDALAVRRLSAAR